MPDPLGRTYIYCAFDATGALLYIGLSTNPDARLRSHERQTPWWSEVASHRVFGPYPRREAYRTERDLIRKHEPRHNRRHTSRFVERGRTSHAVAAARA